jgi:hypothetical protein
MKADGVDDIAEAEPINEPRRIIRDDSAKQNQISSNSPSVLPEDSNQTVVESASEESGIDMAKIKRALTPIALILLGIIMGSVVFKWMRNAGRDSVL